MRHKIGLMSIDSVNFADSLEILARRISSSVENEPFVQYSMNSFKYVLGIENEEFRNILNTGDLINADGVSILLAAKILRIPLPERVSGIDLSMELLRNINNQNASVFLLGSTDEVLDKLKNFFDVNFPGINLVGIQNGYWKESEELLIVNKIAELKPDLLLLGFGSPNKEIFAHKHRLSLRTKVIFGVGGSFDVWAGKTTRAPKFIRKLGLEWFYRFLQEPRRLFARYFFANAKFISSILMIKLKTKNNSLT